LVGIAWVKRKATGPILYHELAAAILRVATGPPAIRHDG
jgi:hypothetical protein